MNAELSSTVPVQSGMYHISHKKLTIAHICY